MENSITIIEIALFYPEYRVTAGLYSICLFVLAFDVGGLASLFFQWWDGEWNLHEDLQQTEAQHPGETLSPRDQASETTEASGWPLDDVRQNQADR